MPFFFIDQIFWMPLQAHNPMAVYRFNRFDGVIARIKGGRTEIWCKILDTLTVNGIDSTGLTKELLHHTTFFSHDRMGSPKRKSLPMSIDLLVECYSKSQIDQLNPTADS